MVVLCVELVLRQQLFSCSPPSTRNAQFWRKTNRSEHRKASLGTVSRVLCAVVWNHAGSSYAWFDRGLLGPRFDGQLSRLVLKRFRIERRAKGCNIFSRGYQFGLNANVTQRVLVATLGFLMDVTGSDASWSLLLGMHCLWRHTDFSKPTFWRCLLTKYAYYTACTLLILCLIVLATYQQRSKWAHWSKFSYSGCRYSHYELALELVIILLLCACFLE